MIEVLGVVSVTAMLFAVVMTVFTAAYRVEASWREEAAQTGELHRLAAYFRHDAHQAHGIEVAGGGGSWSFLLPGDGRIEYELLAGAVGRTELSTTDGRPTRPRRQELSLPESATVNLQEMSLAGRSFVTLTAEVHEPTSGSRSTLLRLDARLGDGPLTTTGRMVDPEND